MESLDHFPILPIVSSAMTNKIHPDTADLATVTVTFNPDIVILERQICELPLRCFKVIVDNASRASVLIKIRAVSQKHNVLLLCNDTNLGLAAALNRGVRAISKNSPGSRLVLLLDQDSEPGPGGVESLLTAFARLELKGERVGSVGPLLVDPETGLTHGFHQYSQWRWKRVYPPAGSPAPVPCANLNGSGTLVPVSLFLQLGGLNEEFFIDHVDTDWAFRLQAGGYSLWGIPDAVFLHRMGQVGSRFWWFGWRIWPMRSPKRHYYLFRNAVKLMHAGYVPRTWKAWAVAKLLATSIITLAVGPERNRQLREMWHGLRDGFRRIASE